MQNPHELVKKEEKKGEKYPRWYKSCIDPWFYFLPDLQFAEKEWIQRLCRSAMIWRVFFFFFSIFSFCTWTRSCHYFCEIFSSVLKVSCCRIYLEITTIWWVRRLKIWYFFWENVERHERCRIKLPTEVLELSVPNTKQRTNLAAP